MILEYTTGYICTAHGFCKLFDLQLRDFPLTCQIMFVPHNDNVLDRELAVVVVLVDPLVQVVEAFLVCDIEYKDAAVCATIVTCCQSAKPLLACCVPQLQSYFQTLGTVHEGPTFAVNANRRIVGWLVFKCSTFS